MFLGGRIIFWVLCKRHDACVEERKKEAENRCFGTMYEGCAPPPLGGRTMARREARGEEKRGGNVASINEKNLYRRFTV